VHEISGNCKHANNFPQIAKDNNTKIRRNKMENLNLMRKKIKEKKFLIGTGINVRDPAISELLGSIFDFLWIDGEHSWMSNGDILNHIISAKATGCVSMVRIPWNDPVLAKPILEMGPDCIVFPQIHNVEEAKAAIAACTYPPKGIRGWGPNRAVNYGNIPAEQYLNESEERIFKILQVENKECVDCLEEIIQLEGVDCLCVGPMDLSGSLGKLTKLNDELVCEYFDRIGKIAGRYNVPLMLSYAYDEEQIEKWKQRGVTIFGVSNDYATLLMEAKRQYNVVQKICEGN